MSFSNDLDPQRADVMDAVREAGRPRQISRPVAAVGGQFEAETNGVVETGRRGHLRILRDR